MNIPQELRYTKDHEWIKVEGDEAVVGITDFAQSELGDIVFVDIGTEGQELKKEEVFGTVEAVKTVSDLFMPVSGTITQLNAGLSDDPAVVNNDPYGKGWMVRIKLSDKNEVSELMSAEDYGALVGA
jgi:glycine cleavage system H protein